MKGSVYEGGISSCLGYLAKRAVLLAAKLLGFKGFCLFLATALLGLGRIGEDVWLTLAITLVCSASGIRVLDSFKEGTDALDAKNAIAARLGGPAAKEEVSYETSWKGNPIAAAGWTAPALHCPGGSRGPEEGPGTSGTTGTQPGTWFSTPGTQQGSGGTRPGGVGGQSGTSGAAERAASRRGARASSAAAKGQGKRGRQRIRAILEEAVQQDG